MNPDRLASVRIHRAANHIRTQRAEYSESGRAAWRRTISEWPAAHVTVQTQGRLISVDEFGNIILRSNLHGSALRLKDVARLELGSQTYNLTGRYNGKPSAILAVYQLPGSNAVDAAKNVRAEIANLAKRFPQDLVYQVSLDTTRAVTAGMREILRTLLIALALVILVVCLFLQGWRATLIPLAAVPVSLIGTFVVFPTLSFSINTLSLFGLVLAIGLVVEDTANRAGHRARGEPAQRFSGE